MRERIKEIIGALITLGLGYASLRLYFTVDPTFAKVVFYLISIITVTVGANQFIFFFESLIRKRVDETYTPFAEIAWWLSPCAFIFYQFNITDDFIPKLIFAILVILFAFVFLLAFLSAISDTTFSKKKVNIIVSLILLVVFFVAVSFPLQRIDIYVLLPFVVIISYSDYILRSFLTESHTDKDGTTQQKTIRTRSQRRTVVYIIGLTNYFKQSFFRMLLLMGLTFIPFVLYIKSIFPIPDTISNLYIGSLTVYTIILSIVTAFAILTLKGRETKRGLGFNKAFLGLAQMCIVFIFLSLIGIFIGVNTDVTIFKDEMTLSNFFNVETVLSNIQQLVQALILESVILSFAPVLLYIYAMLKGFLHQDE